MTLISGEAAKKMKCKAGSYCVGSAVFCIAWLPAPAYIQNRLRDEMVRAGLGENNPPVHLGRCELNYLKLR